MQLTVADAYGATDMATLDVTVREAGAPFLIDDFATPIAQLALIDHSSPTQAAFSREAAGGALGGYRDVYLTDASAPSDNFSRIDAGSDWLSLRVTNDPDVTARATIAWNGPTVFILSGGKITGINGLDVGGTLYDVSFEDSSFDAIWPSGTADAFWEDESAAGSAAAALAAILASGQAPLGAISDPTAIWGIVGVDPDTSQAWVAVPYHLGPNGEGFDTWISASSAVFDASLGWIGSGTGNLGFFSTEDLSNNGIPINTNQVSSAFADSTVYAKFTPASGAAMAPTDLTQGGTNTGFYLDLVYLSAGVTIDLTVWSGAGASSTVEYFNPSLVDFNDPEWIGQDYIFLPFADFTGSANFTAITAIRLQFSGPNGYRAEVYQFDTRHF